MATAENAAPPHEDGDQDLWADAINRQISDCISLQIAGLDPSGKTGHTCFARIISRSGLGVNEDNAGTQIPLRDIVRYVLQVAKDMQGTVESSDNFTCNRAEELLEIGAVWIIDMPTTAITLALDNGGKSRNKSKRKCRPRRATQVGATLACDKGTIIRIHYGAIRYHNVYEYDWGKRCLGTSSDDISVCIGGNKLPLSHVGLETDACSSNAKQGVIIYEDLEKGYAIINKPPGMPVHAYVYNSKENVACMYEEAFLERYPNETSAINVSVPQRLDNDTTGVLVVATKSSFASYMGKLLEMKTSAHIQSYPQCGVVPSVTKRYKCLVCVKDNDIGIDRLIRLADTAEIVTHYYLSSERTIPRVFLDSPVEDREGGSWLECHLRITSVDATNLAKGLFGDSDTVVSLECVAVAQVEVELLTGRTHQIRGQLSALGFPLVGDSVYGGAWAGDICNKMALHCCQLSFPNPIMNIDDSGTT